MRRLEFQSYFSCSDPNQSELSLLQLVMNRRQLFLSFDIIKKKNNTQILESKIAAPKNKMHRLPQHSQTCTKHKKCQSILVVPQAKYICEDCAIFEPFYRHEVLLQKQSIQSQIDQIGKQCLQLFQKEKQLVFESQKKTQSLLRSIEYLQVSLINKINNQFMDIKTRVSETFMSGLEQTKLPDQRNCRGKLLQLYKETSFQQKIKKNHESARYFDQLRLRLENQEEMMGQLFQNLKCEIEKNVEINVNVLSAFQSVLTTRIQSDKYRPTSQNKNKYQQPKDQENLLDFSEFSLSPPPLLPHEPSTHCNYYTDHFIPSTLQSSTPFMKRNKVQRMKTAPCLQDSICSVESIPKSIEGHGFHIAMEGIENREKEDEREPLFSDRSISCASSTVSRHSRPTQHALTVPPTSTTIPTTNHSIKQPPTHSKKPSNTSIEITHHSQLLSKLSTIPSTTKTLKLSCIPITTQQFITLLKEKISKSFIHTLEVHNCPKLNDKVLGEIKTYKCKTLKRVELKQCEGITWSDKRVKEVVKRLEGDGVRVVN